VAKKPIHSDFAGFFFDADRIRRNNDGSADLFHSADAWQ
jgi:hypothetical protein